jgi:thiosulfate dehydrogenase [quinone] large subunit
MNQRAGTSVQRNAAKKTPARRTSQRAGTPPAPRGGRWLHLGPPRHALSLAGWALLPLRMFLGFTFCFAGLQKLANPNFFNSASPSSIQAQMIAAARLSPIHLVIGHLLQFSGFLGIVIALGEIAIGLGALLGLCTRIAALGGAVLSFTLFLTVSFHASPYFTGADIVFFFAWIPLILAGSGGVLSLDGVIRSWARHEANLGPQTVVPVEFGLIQQACGHYDNGHCTEQRGADCDPVGCPFLEPQASKNQARRVGEVERRVLVLGGAAAGATAIAALAGAGVAAGVGRAVGGAKAPAGSSVTLSPRRGSATSTTSAPPSTTSPSGSQSPTTSTTAPHKPAGTAIGPAADVPVGGAASFQDPSSGDPAIVLRPSHATFVAYDAVCPHAGCTVGYASGAGVLVCPCHGSEFNPDTGAVETGPSPTGLRSITIALGGDGQLYADG